MKNSNLNILLVDDDKHANFLNQLVITKSEIIANIVVVHDGEAALEELKNKEFDVVFLDINMPRLNGWETFNRYQTNKENYKTNNCKFIVLSSSPKPKSQKELDHEDVLLYVGKPLTLEKANNIYTSFF